jgi:hypothetical protein
MTCQLTWTCRGSRVRLFLKMDDRFKWPSSFFWWLGPTTSVINKEVSSPRRRPAPFLPLQVWARILKINYLGSAAGAAGQRQSIWQILTRPVDNGTVSRKLCSSHKSVVSPSQPIGETTERDNIQQIIPGAIFVSKSQRCRKTATSILKSWTPLTTARCTTTQSCHMMDNSWTIVSKRETTTGTGFTNISTIFLSFFYLFSIFFLNCF